MFTDQLNISLWGSRHVSTGGVLVVDGRWIMLIASFHKRCCVCVLGCEFLPGGVVLWQPISFPRIHREILSGPTNPGK